MIGLNVSDLVGGDIDARTHDAYLAAYHARDKEDRTSATLGRQRMLYAKRKDGTQFQCIVGVNAVNDEALEEDMLVGYIRCLEMGDDSPAPAAAAGCPVKKETTAASGGCPVKHNKSDSKLEYAPIEKAGESTAYIGDVEEVPLNDLPGVDKKKFETTGKNNGKSGMTSLQRAVKEVNAQKVADALEQAHNMVADDDFTSTGSTEGDDSNCNSNPDLLVSTSV